MKKIGIALLLLLLTPQAFALSTDIKEIYQPGETLIIEIAGNILAPISPANVELKRINVQVPWEYDIKRLDDTYYLYGIVPDTENNYTIHINDVATTEQGIVTEIDFNQTFTVAGELVPYEIKPGFIIAQENVMEFELFLNRDFDEPILVNFPEEHEIILQPGANTLELDIPDTILPGLTHIQIGIYTVPVFITRTEEETLIIPRPIRIFPRSIESTILVDEIGVYPFSIINTIGEDLTDIIIDYNPDIFVIHPEIPDALAANQTQNFNLTLKNANTQIDEIITIRYGDTLLEFPIEVDFTENTDEINTPYLEENFTETQGYFCAEVGGIICAAEDVCSGETINALDTASCCLGACEVSDEGTNLAWIGWLLAFLILVILAIIGGRYLKNRKPKQKDFEKKFAKMQGPPPSTRPSTQQANAFSALKQHASRGDPSSQASV